MSQTHLLTIDWVDRGVDNPDPTPYIVLGFGPRRLSMLPEEAWLWADCLIRFAWAALTGQARKMILYRKALGEEYQLEMLPTETTFDWLQDVEVRVGDTVILLAAKDLEVHGLAIQRAASEMLKPKMEELNAEAIVTLAEDFLRQESA